MDGDVQQLAKMIPFFILNFICIFVFCFFIYMFLLLLHRKKQL